MTESEVVTGKSQTEALPYWPSDSEVYTVSRVLRFSRNDRTVEVIKLFIIWLTVWINEKKKILERKSSIYIRRCARLPIHSVSNPGQNYTVSELHYKVLRNPSKIHISLREKWSSQPQNSGATTWWGSFSDFYGETSTHIEKTKSSSK